MSPLLVHALAQLDQELHEAALLDRHGLEHKSDHSALQVDCSDCSYCTEAQLVLRHFEGLRTRPGPELSSYLVASEDCLIDEDDILLLLDQLDDLGELLKLALELSLQLERAEAEGKLEVSQFDAVKAVDLAQLADAELAVLEALAKKLSSLQQGEGPPGVKSLLFAEVVHFFLCELITRTVTAQTATLAKLVWVIKSHLDELV